MFAYLMFADPGQNCKAQTLIPHKYFRLYAVTVYGINRYFRRENFSCYIFVAKSTHENLTPLKFATAKI